MENFSDQSLNIAHIILAYGQMSHDEARRLAACWNACKGISTEAIDEDGCVSKLREDRDGLLKQQADLVAALRDVMSWVAPNSNWHTDEPKKALERARAVIAKATGKNQS
jgi:hypothetical protein